jgi:hypothetical protein
MKSKFYFIVGFSILLSTVTYSQDCKFKENSFDKSTNISTLISDEIKVFGSLTDGGIFSLKKSDDKYFIVLDYNVTKAPNNISVSKFPIIYKVGQGDKLIINLTNEQKITLNVSNDVIVKSIMVPNLNNVYSYKLSNIHYLISEDNLKSIEGSLISSISLEYRNEGDDNTTYTFDYTEIKEKTAIKLNGLINCILNN